MPSVSKAQQRLMAAAEHGATFPMAAKLRQTMTLGQLHDFAVGSMKGKPAHVTQASHRRSIGVPKASQGRRAGVPSALHPHRNLGAYLHPRKGRG